MKNITYVDYKFQTTKHNRIIFDKELNASTFFSEHNLADGQVCLLRNVEGQLTIVVSDFYEKDSAEEGLMSTLYRNKD